jgi:hypothetical protein
VVIVCARCGKENQKHYKFCLGCGAKLEAPAVTEAIKPAAPEAPTAPVAPVASPRPTAQPSSVGAGFGGGLGGGNIASSGGGGGAGVQQSYGLGGGYPSPAAAMGGGLGAAPVGAAPVAAPLPAGGLDGAGLGAGAGPGGNLGGAAPSGSRDLVPCPKCGKMVVSTYAFCGSCGQRLKPSGAAAGPVAAARTMHLASSAPAARAAPRGHLTLIRPDGTEGGVHPLQDGENLIGRGHGSLFDADPYLSPRHAEMTFTDSGLLVRDLRSLNGVFIKLMHEEKLESGDVFRIGQELLRFDVIASAQPLEDGTEIIGTPNPGFWGRVSIIVGRDVDGPAFPLFDETVVLGRERGDILFPEDGYVSGTHAQLTLRDGQVFLSDLGSSNGTFFRIRGSRMVPSASLLLMGQQLFRASYR